VWVLSFTHIPAWNTVRVGYQPTGHKAKARFFIHVSAQLNPNSEIKPGVNPANVRSETKFGIRV
jgi:hypothetical protein